MRRDLGKESKEYSYRRITKLLTFKNKRNFMHLQEEKSFIKRSQLLIRRFTSLAYATCYHCVHSSCFAFSHDPASIVQTRVKTSSFIPRRLDLGCSQIRQGHQLCISHWIAICTSLIGISQVLDIAQAL